MWGERKTGKLMTIACSSYASILPISHTSQNACNGFDHALQEMIDFLKSLCKMGFIFKFNTNGRKNHTEVKTEDLKYKEKHTGDTDTGSTKMTFKHVETKNDPLKKNLLQPPTIDPTGLTFDALMLCIGKLMGILAKTLPLPKDSQKLQKAFEEIETKIESKVSKTPTKNAAHPSQSKTTQMEELRIIKHKHEITHHVTPTDPISQKTPNYHVKTHKKANL